MNRGAQYTAARVAEEIASSGGKLTQNQIARDLRYSPGSFSHVLLGKRKPGRALSGRIFERYGTLMRWWDEEAEAESALAEAS